MCTITCLLLRSGILDLLLWDWLNQPGAPKAKVNEKPKGETVNYDQLIQAWREGRVK